MFHHEFHFLLQEPLFLVMFLDVFVIVNKGVTQEIKWIDRRKLGTLSYVLITVYDLVCPRIDLIGIGLNLLLPLSSLKSIITRQFMLLGPYSVQAVDQDNKVWSYVRIQ